MYSQEITRCHRAAIVIAIDQSCSMSGQMVLHGVSLSKAEVVSMVVGQLIDELIMRSNRDSEYRHYYDIAIVGYSGDRVYSLIGDELKFYPITILAGQDVPRTTYIFSYSTFDNDGTLFQEDVSLWVRANAQGATPMYKMICRITSLVADWCSREENRDSFPPLVFNVTDGEASDASYDMLRSAARNLRSTGTNDGNTLFMNIHISSDTRHDSIIFPSINEVPLSIRHAHLLMDMSSTMPEQLHHYIKKNRSGFAEPPYYAMSYNSSMPELITMLNIGSRSLIVGL